MPDLLERVRRSLVLRESGGPVAALRVAPRVPGQEGHLRRPESVPQHLEQRKVLQHIRSHLGLAALNLLVLARRDQLGVISVSSTDCSTSLTASSNWCDEMTQRIRCWISVLGTPPLTL